MPKSDVIIREEINEDEEEDRLKNGQFVWTNPMVYGLIEEYEKLIKQFRDPKMRQKDLWQQVADGMRLKGYQVNYQMCDRKWRNLKQTYKSIYYDKRKKRQRTWEFYDLLNVLFLPDPESIGHQRKSRLIVPLSDNEDDDENDRKSAAPAVVPRNKCFKRIKKEDICDLRKSHFLNDHDMKMNNHLFEETEELDLRRKNQYSDQIEDLSKKRDTLLENNLAEDLRKKCMNFVEVEDLSSRKSNYSNDMPEDLRSRKSYNLDVDENSNNTTEIYQSEKSIFNDNIYPADRSIYTNDKVIIKAPTNFDINEFIERQRQIRHWFEIQNEDDSNTSTVSTSPPAPYFITNDTQPIDEMSFEEQEIEYKQVEGPAWFRQAMEDLRADQRARVAEARRMHRELLEAEQRKCDLLEALLKVLQPPQG